MCSEELPDLGKLTNLTWLDLTDTPVKELPGLGKLTKLRGLYLSGTQVRDLPDLGMLIELEQIYLGGTYVKDLPDLSGCRFPAFVDLNGRLFSQQQQEALRGRYKNITFTFGVPKN